MLILAAGDVNSDVDKHNSAKQQFEDFSQQAYTQVGPLDNCHDFDFKTILCVIFSQ